MANPNYLARCSLVLALATALVSIAATPVRKRPAKKADASAAADEEKDTAAVADDPETAPRYGEPKTTRFRVGAQISAVNGACRGIVAMVTVPLECPEQKVTIVSEDFSPEIGEVTYRSVPGGEVKQMLISVPRLSAGATAHAIITAEVTTSVILPPEKTENLKIPKKIPSNIRAFTNPSPYIEINNTKIRNLNKEVMESVGESASDWEKIEKIYDTVLEKIEYLAGPDKGAVEALTDKQADCQGRSAVFIALCRANKIPARMVWVNGHVYPEFYLEYEEGKGHWYPCESAGTRAFGEMPLCRTILQKGDNFRVPERKEKLRYASDFIIGLPVPGGGKPKVKYIRETEGQTLLNPLGQ